jgi:hypothetical protein
MSGKRIENRRRELGTDWERLRNLTDAEVQRAAERDPDARPTDAEFWKSAHLVIPKAKQTITIRSDADLLARKAGNVGTRRVSTRCSGPDMAANLDSTG